MPFVLRKIDLRRAVTLDADHHISKAKRLWLREGSCAASALLATELSDVARFLPEGDIKRGKKNIFHGLRTLHYALQLLRTGSITNIYEANHYWTEVVILLHELSPSFLILPFSVEDCSQPFERVAGISKAIYARIQAAQGESDPTDGTTSHPVYSAH